MCIADHTNTRIVYPLYNTFQGWNKLPARCNVMVFNRQSLYLYGNTITNSLLFLKPTIFIVFHILPLLTTTYHSKPFSRYLQRELPCILDTYNRRYFTPKGSVSSAKSH